MKTSPFAFCDVSYVDSNVKHVLQKHRTWKYPLQGTRRSGKEAVRFSWGPIWKGSRPLADPIRPLPRELLADYAATGLPPAYLPKDEMNNDDQEERHDP